MEDYSEREDDETVDLEKSDWKVWVVNSSCRNI